jgi:YD repeat-containing protein
MDTGTPWQAVGKHAWRRVWSGLAVTVGLTCAGMTWAQDNIEHIYQTYADSVAAAQRREPLGDHAFGEKVSLFSGSTEFTVTDISVPGKDALPVALGRRFVIQDRNEFYDHIWQSFLGGFDDWDVEVPYLEGSFPARLGWIVAPPGDPGSLMRCSKASAPFVDLMTTGFSIDKAFQGYHLHIPGNSDENLLMVTGDAFGTPSDGNRYPWATAGNTRLRCVGQTKNGYPGEGFVAVTPDGKRYTFDWGVEHPLPRLSLKEGDFSHYLDRKRVFLLATRIEDRFGNWVSYTYNGDKLTAITSSDGRAISIGYDGNGHIASATANGRTWTYNYAGGETFKLDSGLATVTLPDGTQWRYQKNGLLRAMFPPHGDDSSGCDPIEGQRPGPFTYQVQHPGGATAQFRFEQYRIFRNQEQSDCTPGPVPAYYDTWGLVSKTVTGAGLASQTTTYAVDKLFSNPNNGKWTTVTWPDGTVSKYHYGVGYDFVLVGGTNKLYSTEGLLLDEQSYAANGALARTQSTSYAADPQVAWGFPNAIGDSPHPFQLDSALIRPVKQVITTQDGVNFQRTTNRFDSRARPVDETEASSLGYQKTETTDYYDNNAIWVLGQVQKQAINGIESSRADFDPGIAKPIRSYSYGKLKSSMGYAADGTVATIGDGNGNTTSLSDWKRGMPQRVGYADGTAITAHVDDNGWVSDTTDENGFTTRYGYDAMGRINRISYPSNDTVAWQDSVRQFGPVNANEYGLPPGHWREVTQTGSYKKTVYYDALWHPVMEQEDDESRPEATTRWRMRCYDSRGREIFASYPRNPYVDGWSNYDCTKANQ